jgi:hypothetical protein
MRAVLLCLGLILLAPSAFAQGGAGLRAGASVDPDQFYFGGHAELGPVVERLWFRPNLEVGVGDDTTVFAFNGEFAYWFPPFNNEWGVYVGGGPALNIVRFDRGPSGDDETDAQGGFNFLLGLAHTEGFFGELKLGVIDSPEFKIGVGYTWR